MGRRSHPNKPNPEQLEWLYARMTTREIAAHLNCDQKSVMNWLREYGIPRRGVGWHGCPDDPPEDPDDFVAVVMRWDSAWTPRREDALASFLFELRQLMGGRDEEGIEEWLQHNMNLN